MQLSLWDGCGGDDFCLAHAVRFPRMCGDRPQWHRINQGAAPVPRMCGDRPYSFQTRFDATKVPPRVRG
jgi:hypothetical protein